VSGSRVLLGDKANLQAISLINRETPLVQSMNSENKDSFVKEFSEPMAAIFSKISGKVKEVTPEKITIDDIDHPIYNNFLTGQKSFIHHVPTVKVGDQVKKGDLLAKSNFTDDEGNLALGTNLTTAVMPYRSLNFEDAYVLTQSGANKLVGEQMIPLSVEKERGLDFDKDKFVSLFPNKYYNAQLVNIDSDGIVKKGIIVNYGDPLVLSFEPRTLKTTDAQLGNISSILKNAFTDRSYKWEYESPGEIVDVAKTNKAVTMTIKTKRPITTGDKISISAGAKGVVSKIIPDSETPTLPDGKKIDILLNSMSVVSRVAPSLLTSIALGKVAQKTGKPIKVSSFEKDSLVESAQKSLKEHKLHDTEQVYDPITGKHLNIFVGPMYVNRLHHISEDKLSSRGQGVSYTIDCYDKETEVLTKRGWIKWEEATLDDEFFSINEKNEIIYQKPIRLVKRFYDGKMLGYKGKYLDWLVTPNHKMWTSYGRKINSTFKYRFTEMSALFGNHINVKQMGFTLNRETYIKEVVVGNKTFLSSDYCEFLGWFISEGSFNIDKNKRYYKVCIWQSEKENAENFARISQLLTRMHIRYWIHKNVKKEKVGFIFSDKQMYIHLLEECGGYYCDEKFIPRNVLLNFSKNDLRLLFDSLILGDGYTQLNTLNFNKNFYYTTVSRKLADTIQELFTLLGYCGFINKYRRSGKLPNGRYSVGYYYKISLSKFRQDATVRPHKEYSYYYETDYKDFVYCAELEGTHLLYVRRNKKPLLSGNSQPAKVISDEKAKKIGNLATNVLLAHNAKHVLEDAAVIRGTKNDEFWRKLKLGQDLPMPEVPFIFNKFISHLEGAGIKVQHAGDRFNVLPQTNKDIESLSKGPIENENIYKIKSGELIPEDGGLFDIDKTGITGDNYNHINLKYPIMNPIIEDYIRKTLGLTQNQFKDLIGKGELIDKIKAINVDKKIKDLEIDIKSTRKTDRDNKLKVLAFLKNLQKNHISLSDLILDKIPVIPAKFRPLVVQGGRVISSGINELYRDLMLVNKNVDDLPADIAEGVRKKQYEGVKAVYGLGDPISVRNVSKNFKGLLAAALGIHGGSAKSSMFQSKVVNKPVDLVGRAVLVPDANLNIDEVGLPQNMVWKMYSSFIIRRLVQSGLPATNAKEYVDNKHPIAMEHLREELKDRPVTVSRDPQLHKYSQMGYFVKLNSDPKDSTLKLNPLVHKQLGADHDGDQLNAYVPASDAAKEEIKEKMLPSKNLISPRNFTTAFTPTNESALGLYLATTEDNKNKPIKFKNEKEVKAAYERGEIGLGDRVEISA
jgi:RNA polymerase Rpb2, domain 6/RNA polymerase Rpb1, domain 2